MTMFGLFQRLEVPRSNVATDNPITYDNGNAVLEFFSPSHEYFGMQTIPPGNKWQDGSASFMAPIAHYHLLQIEKFFIRSGKGIWYLKGKTIELSAGESISIPRFAWHRFESHPDSSEPLVILYRYDPQRFIMEERFFRNTLTYLWDCHRHGVDPSALQLCLFLSDCWMPGGFIPAPGDFFSCMVNAILMWIFAFIGWALYGYKTTYPEYWNEQYVRNRIAQDEKKYR